ncbi:hypothetical protein HanRHA438_Chr14g0646601 [Helianthus annuus]|nr:hypothetical protein HanRHA438_Chr14g0646601 [Helianthus annuus]
MRSEIEKITNQIIEQPASLLHFFVPTNDDHSHRTTPSLAFENMIAVFENPTVAEFMNTGLMCV